MNQEESEIALIEAYLEGRLDEDTLSGFENRLQDDPELVKKLEDYRMIIQEIKTLEEQKFVKTLQSWDASASENEDLREVASNKKETKIFQIRSYLAFAAAITLLAVAMVWFYGNQSASNDPKLLYDAYFHPYEDILSQRALGNEKAPLLAQGMNAYNQGNFETAIEALASFVEANPDHTLANCYLGISYLSIADTNTANGIFLSILGQKENDFQDIAQWYLCLSYLKDENLKAAGSILNEIVKDKTHLFYTQATALKKELH